MSSYLDHATVENNGAFYEREVTHSWGEYTRDRLTWLYGPGRRNSPEALADVAAWNRLGSGRAAA